MYTKLTPRQQDIECYVNLYKDVNGFKPRSGNIDAWSDEQLTAEIQRLSAENDRQMAEERAQEDANVAAFERRVAELIEIGAPNRAAAIAWWIQSALDDEQDLFCGLHDVMFLTGLPSREIPDFRAGYNLAVEMYNASNEAQGERHELSDQSSSSS